MTPNYALFTVLLCPLFANALWGQPIQSVAKVAECAEREQVRACSATPRLNQLLTFLDLNHENDFDSVVAATQVDWLRKKGVERWQMTERYEEKRPQLLFRFRELGLIDAIHAREKHYNYGVIHGATVSRVNSRIEWLKKEWQRGVRFDEIVILSGERVLDEELELPDIMRDWRCCEILPGNEIEMIKWVWPRAELPQEMRRLPVTIVDAKASDWRAHTGDTVDSWLHNNLHSGSVLAVSNQPFVSYQDMTMRNKMPPRFTIETIGEEASDDTMNVVYLDNLARLLFELRKWVEKS